MAIISQKSLFSWEKLETKSDLEILKLVLENLPDEDLMRKLEIERGNGRNDYPIRAIWNSIIAGIVYEHDSIESLIRELKRNPSLASVCGFGFLGGNGKIPTKWVYTRFLKRLLKKKQKWEEKSCDDLIEDMFDKLVEEVKKLLPDFSKSLAVDSKAINSFAKKENKKEEDGRRDTDADYGKKTYRGTHENGTAWETVKKWFGYKLHLLVDSKYELPIAYNVTKASASDTKNLLPLIEKTKERHPELIERAEECAADKGYDSEGNIKGLLLHGINPVIDIRNMWKDGEETKAVYDNARENIVYDYKGTVYCCPDEKKKIEMAFCGYESDRESLKYRCPAEAYGFECEGKTNCLRSDSDYGKIVRIKLETDPRIFTPIARSSYKWKDEYKKRTAVERVNSRIDLCYGFNKHKIRGQRKLELKMGISLCIMLATAVGHIKAEREERMRSLFGEFKATA